MSHVCGISDLLEEVRWRLTVMLCCIKSAALRPRRQHPWTSIRPHTVGGWWPAWWFYIHLLSPSLSSPKPEHQITLSRMCFRSNQISLSSDLNHPHAFITQGIRQGNLSVSETGFKRFLGRECISEDFSTLDFSLHTYVFKDMQNALWFMSDFELLVKYNFDVICVFAIKLLKWGDLYSIRETIK